MLARLNSRLDKMLDEYDIQPLEVSDEMTQYLDSGELILFFYSNNTNDK